MTTENKFSNEKQIKHWARMLAQSQMQQTSVLQRLMPPRPPLTRAQKLRNRIASKVHNARMRIGSWIAGVDLDD